MDATRRFEKFLADAREADERMQRTGAGYAAADVYAYLEARVAGRRKARPVISLLRSSNARRRPA
jgi:hypothetical protein